MILKFSLETNIPPPCPIALLVPTAIFRLFAPFEIGAFGHQCIGARLMLPFGLVIGRLGFFNGLFPLPAFLVRGGLLPAALGLALFFLIGECGGSFSLVISFAGTSLLPRCYFGR